MSCCSRRSRGVGAILAAVFMLLILVLGFAVFMVIQAQMGEFQESVETMNTLDWQRSQEALEIAGQPTSSLTSSGALNMTVTNNGGVEARILFVGILNNNEFNHTYFEPCILPCASASPILLNAAENVSGVSAFSSSTFNLSDTTSLDIHLITERGNIVQAYIRAGTFLGTGQGPGGGAGFGFPFTLLLDMSADWYSNTNWMTNTLTLYATNLADTTMSNVDIFMTITVASGEDPEFFPDSASAGLIGTTPTSKTIQTITAYAEYSLLETFTISADQTMFVEFIVEIDGQWKSGVALRIDVTATGTVDVGEGPITITTNIAFVKLIKG